MIFSLLLILLIIPVIIIFAIFIKIEDRGPIFYFGNRLGKNGTVFKMYKLRSMKVNAPDLRNSDGSTFNSNNDPRLTNIGRIIRKTSVDELPQVFNIFLGHMSFLGPRPDLPEHFNYYVDNEFKKLEVLPGVSGYNQAYFRNSAEWKERLQNDVYYVENVSFLLDVKILFKTIVGLLNQHGVYSKTDLSNLKGENSNV